MPRALTKLLLIASLLFGTSTLGHARIDRTEQHAVTAPSKHPFFDPLRNAFVPAGELAEGSPLSLSNGTRATVVGLRRRAADAGTMTYNFEVEDFHTYFVGESGVWVHNSGAFNCEELFSVWYRHLDDFDGDHWRAFKGLMDDPPPAWAEVWPERWRLRGLNEVRLDWLTSPSRGATKPPWRNAAVNNPGAPHSAPELAKNLNTAFGFQKAPEGFTAHHIVMSVDSPNRPNMKALSDEARDIMARNGNIDINDAANGTYLPTTGAKTADFADDVYGPRHMVAGEPNFHSLEYLTGVVEELRKVDGQGRDAVTDMLQEIAGRIIERDFPGIPQL